MGICAHSPSSLATVRVEDLRLGVTPERTRVVLDLSSAHLSYREIPEGDSALTVLLADAVLAERLDPTLPAQGRLESGEFTVERDLGVTLRLRFRQPSSHVLFVLGRKDSRPDRLVIDIQGSSSREVLTQDSSASEIQGEIQGEVQREAQERAQFPDTQARSPSGERTPAEATPEPHASPAHRGEAPRIVVLDAGHGGDDPGAVSSGLREKEICLDVAQRLGQILSRSQDVKPILTRRDDTRIPLRQRMRLAEHEGADLFVSIHLNAAKSRVAHGVEVFFLSLGAASDEASLELARLENEADPEYVIEEDADLRGIPFSLDLRQSDTLLRSSRAAETILDLFVARHLAENRGVKQAGFAVLKSFQVPSILIELGFISSQRDRQNLKSADHRQVLAQALADGIRQYFETYAPRRMGDIAAP